MNLGVQVSGGREGGEPTTKYQKSKDFIYIDVLLYFRYLAGVVEFRLCNKTYKLKPFGLYRWLEAKIQQLALIDPRVQCI